MSTKEEMQERLAEAVLQWWEEHEYDSCNCCDYTYPTTPEFIAIAQELSSGGIDSEDAPDGYIAVPAPSKHSCSDCDLKNNNLCLRVPCAEDERQDGMEVIFKRMPFPAA